MSELQRSLKPEPQKSTINRPLISEVLTSDLWFLASKKYYLTMKQIIQDLKKGNTILEEVLMPQVKAGNLREIRVHE